MEARLRARVTQSILPSVVAANACPHENRISQTVVLVGSQDIQHMNGQLLGYLAAMFDSSNPVRRRPTNSILSPVEALADPLRI